MALNPSGCIPFGFAMPGKVNLCHIGSSRRYYSTGRFFAVSGYNKQE